MSKVPTSPPGVPGTPSAKARICKKLVIKGHASSSGASYTLFLKVQLPATEQEEIYDLLKDPAVELQDAIVHRLDASGAAPALSTSAATAASSLGIPLSIDHELNDSLIDFQPAPKGRLKDSAASSDQSNLPRVVRANDGKIVLKSPFKSSPRSKPSTSSPKGSSSYMVTLHLLASPSSKPPFSPFSVRLAVPFCLNNFMRFTVDESIDQDLGFRGLAVEVDPPILPISGQLKSSQRRPPSSASSRRALSVASLSDEEDVTLLGAASVDDSDLEQDESAIVGPFHACDALVLRIAAPQAGDWVSSDLPYRTLPNALRAKKAVSSITFQPRARQLSEGKGELSSDVEDKDGPEVAFEAAIKLQEPFFPGLDREVLLYMQLDPPASVISWQPKAVDASRGILSWSFGSLASTSSSPNQLPRLHSDGVLTKCPTFDIGDLVVLPDPAQQAADEEDLLKVAPPKGIHDVDFDFSLDNATATPTKQRRFSLQSAGSAKPYPSQPPSEHSEAVGGIANMLVVAFNLLPVLQSDEPVVVSVSGTITLNSGLEGSLQHSNLSKLPKGLLVPAALAQEYMQTTSAAAVTSMSAAQLLEQPIESLEASRETVQQQEYKHGLSMQSLNPNNNAPADEILRQALGIIEAHNASLSDPSRSGLIKQDVALEPRREEGQGNTRDWILRASHLLWTLFLTALVLMLFNAGQTANRDLAARLEELSRMVEASAQLNAQRLSLASDHIVSAPTVPETDISAAPSISTEDCSECTRRWQRDIVELREEYFKRHREGATSDYPVPPSIPSECTECESLLRQEFRELADVYWNGRHKGAKFKNIKMESESVWPAESMEVRPNADEVGVTYFVSSWLKDLLRAPVMILQRIFGILTGA